MLEWAVRKNLFRNVNHALWFLMSMWILFFVTAYYFYPNFGYLILIPLFIHFVAFVQSSWVVFAKKSKSETFSKDCTWFNAYMAIIYLVLFLVINRVFINL